MNYSKKFLILLVLLVSLLFASSVAAVDDNANSSSSIEKMDNSIIQTNEITNDNSYIDSKSQDKLGLNSTGSNGTGVINMTSNNKTNTSIISNSTVNTSVGVETIFNAFVVDDNGVSIENGVVYFTVDNSTLTSTIGDGNYSTFSTIFNKTGVHNVLVSYYGDENYLPSNTTITVIVQNESSSNTTVNYYIPINLTGQVIDENGLVVRNTPITITFDNDTVITTVTDSDGRFSIDVSSTIIGQHIKISYNITVKRDTILELWDIAPVKLGDDITIMGTLLDSNNQVIGNEVVLVDINGMRVNITTNSTGGYVYTYIPVNAGDYNVTVIYNGNDKYNGVTNRSTFKVSGGDATITLNPIENNTVGTPVHISGILVDENAYPISNATVTLSVDNKTIDVWTNNNGTFSYIIGNLTNGTHIVMVLYIDYNTNKTVNVYTNFTTKNTPNLTIKNNGKIVLGETITVNGTLTDVENKPIANVTLTVDVYGVTTFVTTGEDGEYSYSYVPTSGGNYTVIVTYSGDEYNMNVSINKTVIVALNNTIITLVSISNATTDVPVTVTGNLTDDYGEPLSKTNVTIILDNGTNVTVTTDEYGTFNYTFYDFDKGNHTVNVTYTDFETGENITNTTSFTIKDIPTIDINPINNVHSGEVVNITGTVTLYGEPLSNANLSIEINGTKINVTTYWNGKFNTSYIPTNIGQYNVTIFAYETDEYLGSNKTTLFNVNSESGYIDLKPVDNITKGANSILGGTLCDNEGNPIGNTTINVTIDGETTEVETDNEGNFNVTLPTDTVGEHNVTVSYDNTNDTTISNSTRYNVKIRTHISLNSNNTKSGETINITGKLIDSEGNVISNADVVVNINGTRSTVRTNADGEYSYSYVPTSGGNYTVIVTYSGDDTHNSATNTTTVKVSSGDVTITLNPIENNTVGTPVHISGILVDENAYPISNATVTLIIDNKTSTLWTDVNGTFSYITGNLTNGTHIVTVSYTDYNTNKTVNATRIFVTKAVPVIVLNLSNVVYVDSVVNISGNVTYDAYPLADVSLIVDINGTSMSVVTDANGRFVLSYIPSNVGEYYVNVSIDENDKFIGVNNFTTFKVIENVGCINLNWVGNVTKDSNATLWGRLYDYHGYPIANATLNVTIDNMTMDVVSDEYSGFNITLPTSSVGRHNVTVSYTDEAGTTISNTTDYYVKSDVSLIIYPISNITLGYRINITGTLSNYWYGSISNANLVIDINGTRATVITNEYGEFNYSYIPTNGGYYDVIVFYLGSDVYYNATNSTVFVVSNNEPIIYVDYVNNSVKDSLVMITGKLFDVEYVPIVNATVNIFIDDYIFSNVTTDVNGVFNCTIRGYDEGNHTVTVYYTSPTTNKTVSDSKNFTIKGIAVININSIANVYPYDTVNITGNVIYNYEALVGISVIIDINGTYRAVTTDASGRFVLSYTPNNVGEYNVTVYVNESKWYSYTYKNIVFNVIEDAGRIDLNWVGNVTKYDNLTLTGWLYDYYGYSIANATINVTINNQTFEVITAYNGSFKVVLSTDTIGINNVTVSYTDEYGTITTNSTLYTVKIGTYTILNPINDTLIGETINIGGYLIDFDGNPIVNANLTININGTRINVLTDADGMYSYSYVPTRVGKYNITIYYAGDYIYTSSNTTQNITVNNQNNTKIATNITLYVNNATYGNTSRFRGYLIDEYGNGLAYENITLYIDNYNVTLITNATGGYNYSYIFNNTGNHTIEVVYSGNNTYLPSKNSYNIIIDKINTIVNFITTNTTINVGENTLFIIGLTDEYNHTIRNATINLLVDGTVLTGITDYYGRVNFTYNFTQGGIYLVEAVYNGSSIYNGNSIELFITVVGNTSIKTNISANLWNRNITIGDTTFLEVYLTANDIQLSNSKISVVVGNDTLYGVTDENGSAVIYITFNNVGLNKISVYYNGSEEYLPSNITIYARVSKINTSLIMDNVTVTIGVPVTFNVTVVSGNGSPVDEGIVVLEDSNGNYLGNASVVDGVARINVTISTNISYITAIYLENSKYLENNTSFNITINEINNTSNISTLISVFVDDVNVGGTFNITGRLMDVNGNNITNASVNITVNGVFSVIVKTDIDGWYSYETSMNNSGNYTVIVCYNGSKGYNSSINSTYFTVSKMNTIINIMSNNSMINVGDNIIFSVYLVNEYNYVVRNATVTLVIDGHNFTGVTDYYGIINFTYNFTRNGIYLVEAIYNGSNVYNENSIELFITVVGNNTTFVETNISASLWDYNVTVGNYSVLYVNLTANDTPLKDSNVSVIIGNDVLYGVTDENGSAMWYITFNNTGLNRIIVYYNGSDKYLPSNTTVYVNVTKIRTSLIMENITATIGVPVTVNITIISRDDSLVDEGIVVLGDSDGNYLGNASVVGGVALINVTFNQDADYIIAMYDGTSKYYESNATVNVTVNKLTTRLYVNSSAVSLGTPINITTQLLDSNYNPVSGVNLDVIVDNDYFTVTTGSDGVAVCSVVFNTSGVKTVLVRFNGSTVYLANKTVFNLTIPLNWINVTFSNVTVYDGDVVQLNATVIDELGRRINYGSLLFNVNNKNYTTNVINGSASIIINDTLTSNTTYNISGYYLNVSINNQNIKMGVLNYAINLPFMGDYTEIQEVLENYEELSVIKLNDNITRDAGSEESIVLNRSITLDGNGYTIDANNGTLFVIENDADVVLKNMVITNLEDNNLGSFVQLGSGTLVLENITISTSNNGKLSKSNKLSNDITNENITSLIIVNNTGSVLQIVNSTIKDITGTAIINNGILEIINSTITGIESDTAAIYNYATLTIKNTVIKDNIGDILHVNSLESTIIDNVTFTHNNVEDAIIYVIKGNATINQSIFANNTGILIYSDENGTFNVSNSVLLSNNRRQLYNIGNLTPTADYNWFGSNTKTTNVEGVTINNWVIMNVTTSIDEKNSSTQHVFVSFNNYMDDNGEIHKLVGSIPDGLGVNYTVDNGELSQRSTSVVNGISTNNLTTDVITKLTVTQANQNIVLTVTPAMKNTILTLTTTNTKVDYGDNVTIIIKLVDANGKQLDGDVILTIGDKKEVVSVTNGSQNYTFKATTGGNNTITAVYEQTTLYDASSSTINVYVKSNTSIVIISANNITYGQRASIIVVLEDNNAILFNKTLKLSIDNKTITNTSTNGAVIFTYTPTSIGELNYTILFEDDGDYLESQVTGLLNVSEKTTYVVSSSVIYATGSPVNITAYVYDSDNRAVNDGNVIFTSGDGKILGKSSLTNGTATISVVFNSTSTDSITIKYNNTNTNYKESNTRVTASINIAGDITIKTNSVDGVVDKAVTLSVNITTSNSTKITEGNVIFMDAEGKTLVNTTAANASSVNITFNKTYNAYVLVNYTGSSNYESILTTIPVKINPLNVTLKSYNQTIAYIGDNVTIKVNLVDSNNKNVTTGYVIFNYNNTVLGIANVTSGNASITTKLYNLSNTVKINYVGMDRYNNLTTNINVTTNKLTAKVNMTSIKALVGDNVTLTAKVVDNYGKNIESGNVYFRINGTNLKYSNGSDVIVTVNKGYANTTYTIPVDWRYNNSRISAYYAGNNIIQSAISSNTTINASLRNVNLTFFTDSNSYYTGDTINVRVIVTDKGVLVNSGTVTFKFNGVTIKDTNGTAIQVKVTNGVATLKYVLPNNIGAGNYTFNVVFGGSIYNRYETTTTITLQKTDVHVEVTPIIATNKTTQLTAHIYDGHNNAISGTTRISIKINGATVISNANITNGLINFTIPTSFTTGLFNVTINVGENSYYKGTKIETKLLKT